ncbi:hypothetical protein TYRP_014755 [Tyrophagus putrescentiae]|nr:hypothetical protein TYRP_014755 [Tyrophagus putrescentiae]
MASICHEEEELELLRRLHLFSLALKNTMSHESGPQQQQQNLDRLLDQLERAFSGMPTEVKATVWYSKLRLEWEKKILEYRSIQKKASADADEKSLPDKGSKGSVEVEVIATTSKPESEEPQQPQPLIKSKLQPTAVEFTPRFSPYLPPFLVEGIGGASTLATTAASSSFISNDSYIGTKTITETTPPNPNQSQSTEHFHHHFHHHFLHHSSPFNSFEWPAAPTTPTLPAISFFSSSSSTFPQRVVVAPDPLRFQILSLIALFPPVTNPTGIADLNNLFASVAFTARWIFDYLDDDLFQTAVFQGFFSRMPVLLQELFINPLPPPIIITSSSTSPFSSQVEPRKPYEPKLVNLIAFLRRFLLSLMMRTRARAQKDEEENKGRGKLPLPPPTHYCAFCKRQTSHNIVHCPFRLEALCHRCFMTGHKSRQCRNPSLLPPAWLNSGQIKFEGEEEADTFLLLHPK